MTKILAWVAAVLTAVVVATGAWVTFRYRPDAHGSLLGAQRLHAWSGVALGVVLVVGLAAFVWERRPDRRHGLPAFAAVAVLAVLLLVEVRVGRRIAWDQVALWAVVGPDSLHRVHGVLLRDLPLKFVISDTTEYGVGAFRRRVWAHVLVLPALVGAVSVGVAFWVRRFGRPEARPPRPGAD